MIPRDVHLERTMFHFEDPSDLDTDWYLGDRKKCLDRIPKEILQRMANFHLIGVQFLHENFMKKSKGVILNEDEDMNMPLQVCAFLRSIKNRISVETPVLIVCPENSLSTWHYHFTEVGFKPQIVFSEAFNPSKIYILKFEAIRLLEKLAKINFFCTVIDEFDSIALKQFVRKIQGNYKIGLTKRNFYMNPDHKLRWTMLNWASPGCVGKLKDFYSIDRLHTQAFADNYRFWWMRLTWKYCSSFEKPNEDEKKDFQLKVMQWQSKLGLQSKPNPKDSKLKGKVSSSSNLQTKQNLKRALTRKRPFREQNENNADQFKMVSVELNAISSSDEENETKMKKSKSTKESPINEEVEIKSEKIESLNDVDKSSINEDDLKLELENIEPDESVVKLDSDTDDLFDLSSSSLKRKKSESDYEDPILSIINSQVEIEENDKDLESEMNRMLRSSDSDSDFLADLVKTNDRSRRSQQITQLLEDLSDIEPSCSKVSDDDDFFSELVLGKSRE